MICGSNGSREGTIPPYMQKALMTSWGLEKLMRPVDSEGVRTVSRDSLMMVKQTKVET